MNRQSQYDTTTLPRPRTVSSHHHQLRSSSDSELVVKPPYGSNNDVFFSSPNSSSESGASHHERQFNDENACVRDGPVVIGGVGSPASVIDLEVFSNKQAPPSLDEDKSTESKDKLTPPKIKKTTLQTRGSRGVDPPKKSVDTQNVYVSAIANHSSTTSSRSDTTASDIAGHSKILSLSSCSNSDEADSTSISLDELLDQLLAPSIHERTALPLPPKPASQGPPPHIPRPAAATIEAFHHRRQNTSDSTKSAVAAVARGASKALEEAKMPASLTLMDRPVLCPRRQQTAGSDKFPLCDDDVTEKDPKFADSNSERYLGGAKSPARIVRPRPPRHDCIKSDGSGITIKLMQRSVLKNAATNDAAAAGEVRPEATEVDRPAAYPSRQRNTVTPEALEETFGTLGTSGTDDNEHHAHQNSDARDDDSFVLEVHDQAASPVLCSDRDRAGAAQRSPATLHNHNAVTSETAIQAWLNMPQQRWPNSEPILQVPHDLSTTLASAKSESDLLLQERMEASTLFRQPSYDESTISCNDAARDDRMFQAWLNMPPRACTTHNDDPVILKSVIGPTTASTTMDVAEQWVAASRSAGNISDLEVSAMVETSEDNVSLLSCFPDCRGFSLDTRTTATTDQQCHPQVACIAEHTKTPIGSTNSTLNIAQEAAADLRRRMSLPPPMPHRRKPSLHMDDSIEMEGEQDKVVNSLWSSMPAFAHSTLPGKGNEASINLRSSWPTIRARLDSEDSATTVTTTPPSLPTRFRRQDSLLSEEADCETMDKHSLPISQTRRASMPPLQPHRRKPSLLLDDITATSGGEDPYSNGKVESMWSSMPAFSKANLPPSRSSLVMLPRRSSLELPPTMPHRRKPSLNILEDGEDGMIEMWLTHDHHLHGRSTTSVHYVGAPGSVGGAGPAQRHRRQLSKAESVCSIFLMEGEIEI